MGQIDRDRWIAQENIARFEHQLMWEKDAHQREVLHELLAREREKLQEKKFD